MQLIDIRTVQGRVNSILLLIEKDDDASNPIPAYNAIRELAAGLDFYAEAPRPERSSNVQKKGARKSKRRRR